ncbi:hypothetical protein SMJ63A_30118 [Stenotrophomonas geniculata]
MISRRTAQSLDSAASDQTDISLAGLMDCPLRRRKNSQRTPREWAGFNLATESLQCAGRDP